MKLAFSISLLALFSGFALAEAKPLTAEAVWQVGPPRRFNSVTGWPPCCV